MYASFTDSVHLLSLGSDPPRSCSAALSLSLHSASLSGRLSSTALKLAFGAAEKLKPLFFFPHQIRDERSKSTKHEPKWLIVSKLLEASPHHPQVPPTLLPVAALNFYFNIKYQGQCNNNGT